MKQTLQAKINEIKKIIKSDENNIINNKSYIKLYEEIKLEFPDAYIYDGNIISIKSIARSTNLEFINHCNELYVKSFFYKYGEKIYTKTFRLSSWNYSKKRIIFNNIESQIDKLSIKLQNRIYKMIKVNILKHLRENYLKIEIRDKKLQYLLLLK